MFNNRLSITWFLTASLLAAWQHAGWMEQVQGREREAESLKEE